MIGGCWVYINAHPLSLFHGEDVVFYAKASMAHECHTGRLVILGDSRAALGFDPTYIDPGVTNLALPSGGQVQSYHFARQLVNCPHPPKAIIISYGNNAFFGHWDYRYPMLESIMRYGRYDFSDMEEIRYNVRRFGYNFLGQETPGDLELRLREFGYATRFPAYYFHNLYEGKRFGLEAINQPLYDEMYTTNGAFPLFLNGYATANIQGLAPVTAFTHSKQEPYFDDYFDRTLALLTSHHISVYFAMMPLNQASKDALSPTLVADYKAYLKQYTDRYPGFHLLLPDYPVQPDQYFLDPDHQNFQGAVVWSKQFRTILNEAKVEGYPYAADPQAGRKDTVNIKK